MLLEHSDNKKKNIEPYTEEATGPGCMGTQHKFKYHRQQHQHVINVVDIVNAGDMIIKEERAGRSSTDTSGHNGSTDARNMNTPQ